jgi:hypothetical protein
MSPDFNDDPDSVPYADFATPQSLNLYTYVGNNPLTGVDPDGHLDCSGGATQDVACLVQAGINTLKSLFSGGSGDSSNGDDHGPTSVQSNHSGSSPQLQNRSTQASRLQQYCPSCFSSSGSPVVPPNTQVAIGIVPFGMTGGLSTAVPGLMRMRLLSTVTNPKLRNIISDLYKATSSFGNGGTADAIAYERATGQAVGGAFHTIKGEQYSRALQTVINSGTLNDPEKSVAQYLLNELQSALTSTGR